MSRSNHAMTLDYNPGGGVLASCSCGWGPVTYTTNALALAGHNAHLTTRGVAVRVYA